MGKKIVVDTDVLVDLEHSRARWLNEVLAGSRKFIPILPTIVISEYWASQRFDDASATKSAEKTLGLFRKYDFNEPVAKVMGEIMRHRSYPSGASISDLIVASTAIYLNAPLATRNTAHYHGIPGLQFFKTEND